MQATSDALTAVVFGGHSDLPPRVRLKGDLLGFPRIEHPIGIKIDEIAIVRDKRSAFATLLAQPVLDRLGRQKRDIGLVVISERDFRRGERATRGPRPGDRPPAVGTNRSEVWLLAFKSMRKGKLLGFARVEFPNGLQISNIPIFADQNGPFAALPSRPILDQEGRQKRYVNGNPHYLPFLQWRDRSLSGRFSDSTVALVLKANAEFANGDRSGQ